MHTPTGALRCTTVVNAAGAWGDVVAERCGVRPLGLRPMRRTAGDRAGADVGDGRWSWTSPVATTSSPKQEGCWCRRPTRRRRRTVRCTAEEIDVALALDRFAGHRSRRGRAARAGLGCARSRPTVYRCSARIRTRRVLVARRPGRRGHQDRAGDGPPAADMTGAASATPASATSHRNASADAHPGSASLGGGNGGRGSFLRPAAGASCGWRPRSAGRRTAGSMSSRTCRPRSSTRRRPTPHRPSRPPRDPQVDVVVRPVAPCAHDRGRHDHGQRRALGDDRRDAEAHDHRRHHDDPAADAEQAGEDAADQARRPGAATTLTRPTGRRGHRRRCCRPAAASPWQRAGRRTPRRAPAGAGRAGCGCR